MVRIPVLHFNDVYRIQQNVKTPAGTKKLTADQFAAIIHKLRKSWPNVSDTTEAAPDPAPEEDPDAPRDWTGHQSTERAGLVLFSGDVFNPSVESSVTRGEHMIPVMNGMAVDVSVIGNHDLDFSAGHLRRLMGKTNFPWLFSNVADVSAAEGKEEEALKDSEEPQAFDGQPEGTLPFWISKVQGIRIGIVGLIEKDWIKTIPSFPTTWKYRSMASVARKLSSHLRTEQKCDLVFALTHCRLPNDIDLANEVGCVADAHRTAAPGGDHIDLILGGHDHTFYIGKGADKVEGEAFERPAGSEKDSAALIVKSGTDFRDLSEVWLEVGPSQHGDGKYKVIKGMSVQRHRTTPDGEHYEPMQKQIEEIMERIGQATGKPVVNTLTAWDVRSEKVRTQESAIGDFIADILLHAYDDALQSQEARGELKPARPAGARQVDIALLCGGALRGDTVYGPGLISLGDILEIMPFEDAVVVKEIQGKYLLEALESALSAYPKQEGRFPVVAGMSIKWDSKRPPGQRILEAHLLEDGHLFEGTDNENRLQMKARRFEIVRHKNGYDCEVYRPAIVQKELIQEDKTYRVVTREYLSQGYDGFEALKEGHFIIDHENGALMSTLVRKYLLGASFLWRMKQIRSQSEDSEPQRGRKERPVLSRRTKSAIDRALAIGLSDASFEDDEDSKPNGASVTGDANVQGASLATPQKKRPMSRLMELKRSVDQSPSGIRNAIHVGASEHHSDMDHVIQTFRGPRSRSRSVAQGLAKTTQDDKAEGEEKDVKRTVQITHEEAEDMASIEDDVAVVAPFVDGRLVDVSRVT